MGFAHVQSVPDLQYTMVLVSRSIDLMRSSVICLQNYAWQTKASDTFVGQVSAFRYAVEPIPGGHTLG